MSRLLTLVLVLGVVGLSLSQTPSSTLKFVGMCRNSVRSMLESNKIPLMFTTTFAGGEETHTITLVTAFAEKHTTKPIILVSYLKVTVKGEEVSTFLLGGWWRKSGLFTPLQPNQFSQPVVEFQSGDRIVFVYAALPNSEWKETWLLLTGNANTPIVTLREFLSALGVYLALGNKMMGESGDFSFSQLPQPVLDSVKKLPFVPALFLHLHALSKHNPQYIPLTYALSDVILTGEYPQWVDLAISETKRVVVNPRRWAELEGKNFEDAVSTVLAWNYLPEEEQQPLLIAGGNNQPFVQISMAGSTSMPPLLPSIEDFYRYYWTLYWLLYYRPTPYHPPHPRMPSTREIWSSVLWHHAHKFDRSNPLHRPAILYVLWLRYLVNRTVEPGDEIFAYYLLYYTLERNDWFIGAAAMDFILKYYIWDALNRPSIQRLLQTPFHIDMIWREFWKAVYPDY